MGEKYCWCCGKTDHAGRECPFYESWVVWDLDQDGAVLKKFQLKADHPPNPPDPPFQTDPSKKWWKSLNKNQGYGSKLYRNAQHWKKRQGQKNKKQKIAAASDSKSKSHANRIEMEKGKDYSELLNVLADTMVLNLDDPKDCELAQKASAEGYRQYLVNVGKYAFSVIVDTGAWKNYMVASILEQIKLKCPECILEMGSYKTHP